MHGYNELKFVELFGPNWFLYYNILHGFNEQWLVVS